MPKKMKLINERKEKKYKQAYVAGELGISEPSYNRRENGKTKINDDEWEDIAKILGVPLDKIYEPNEKQIVIYKDNNFEYSNGPGNNNTIHTIPEFKSMFETQQKYIKKLEQENKKQEIEIQKLKAEVQNLKEQLKK